MEMPSNSFSLDPRLVSLLNSFLEMGVDATKHSSPSAILCQQKSRGGYELIRDCNDDISLSLVLANLDSIENQYDPLSLRFILIHFQQ